MILKTVFYMLLNEKKALKKFYLRTWCMKEPFGYLNYRKSKIKTD